MRFLHALFIVIVLWAALFIPGLGDTELKGEEGRRILPAREMLRRDNFVLPYSEGRPYHRKPPGINWAIAASFKVTGVQNEWTARAPSVIALLALALVGLWAGNKVGGLKIGLPLAITLLINGGMLEKGRLAEIEAVYVSLVGIGMLIWAAQWIKAARPFPLWLSTVIPFALANLTKGPVYLLFFYPIVIVALVKTKRFKDFFHPAHLVSLLLALAPMITWGVLVKQEMADFPVTTVIDDEGNEIEARTPGEVWWRQISGRLEFTNIDWGSWGELPFRVLLLLAPWPLLAWWCSRKLRGMAQEPDRLEIMRRALGWGTLWSVVAFCLLPATRARYLMPALAPVCFWSVLTIVPVVVNSPRFLRNWYRIMVGVLIIAALTALLLPFLLNFDSRLFAVGINAAAIVVLVFAMRLVKSLSAPLQFFCAIAPPMALLAMVLATTVYPAAKLHENVRPTAAAINAVATTPGSIAAVAPGPQPFLFYLGPRCAEVVKITDYPPDTAYVLLAPKNWENPAVKDRLVYQGFSEVLLTLKDARFDHGRDYVLVGRPANYVPRKQQ